MKLVFEYKKFHDRNLPIIPIKLQGPQKFVETNALVDSGSTISVFSHEVAELAGIDYKKHKVVYPLGASGRIKAHLVELNVGVGIHKIKCKALFSDNLKAKFNLLGMQGFFDYFKVCFDNKNRLLSLETH
ncbi:MAG: retropepsin-like aspartic protease [archaeon]